MYSALYSLGLVCTVIEPSSLPPTCLNLFDSACYPRHMTTLCGCGATPPPPVPPRTAAASASSCPSHTTTRLGAG